jgi:FMN phosphatase YigB (HAD superfamily)
VHAVLFDLDGTLLDIDIDAFMRRYMRALAAFTDSLYPGDGVMAEKLFFGELTVGQFEFFLQQAIQAGVGVLKTIRRTPFENGTERARRGRAVDPFRFEFRWRCHRVPFQDVYSVFGLIP